MNHDFHSSCEPCEMRNKCLIPHELWLLFWTRLTKSPTRARTRLCGFTHPTAILMNFLFFSMKRENYQYYFLWIVKELFYLPWNVMFSTLSFLQVLQLHVGIVVVNDITTTVICYQWHNFWRLLKIVFLW